MNAIIFFLIEKNSKIVNFDSIKTLLSESEWKSKFMISKSITSDNISNNQRNKGAENKQQPIQIIPRERPKSTLNLNKLSTNDNNNNSQQKLVDSIESTNKMRSSENDQLANLIDFNNTMSEMPNGFHNRFHNKTHRDLCHSEEFFYKSF